MYGVEEKGNQAGVRDGLKHSALRFLERTADFSEVEKVEGKGLGCMPN